MRSIAIALFVVAPLALVPPAHGQRKAEYLKEEPRRGSIPQGKVVYVDDGACPRGEVKRITGGNREKGIPREVRCVKRPD